MANGEDLLVVPEQMEIYITVSPSGAVILSQPADEPCDGGLVEIARANIPLVIAALQKVLEG